VSKGKNLASNFSLYLKTTAVGLCAVGFIQDRYGSRKTIIWGMIFLTGALFLLFFATSLGMLVAGYVLIGLPLGAFQISSTVFASEVCPIRLRPYLTCWVCMSWGVSSTDSSNKSLPSLTRPDTPFLDSRLGCSWLPWSPRARQGFKVNGVSDVTMLYKVSN
jgi:hypothetical protein